MDFDKDDEFARHQRAKRGRGHRSQRSHDNDKYESQTVAQDEATSAAKSVEGWILFVSGVHEEATEEEMLDVFGEFGQVKNLHLNLDRRTCDVKGYALIEYEDIESAERAIAGANGNELNDKILQVNWAFLKGPIRQR